MKLSPWNDLKDMAETTTFSRRKRHRSVSCNIQEGDKTSGECLSSFRPSVNKNNSEKTRSAKKSGGQERRLVQMFLDVGQKNFFSTTCSECGFVYTPGKKEEERLHLSHHEAALSLNMIKLKTLPAGSVLLMDDGKLGQIYKMYYFKNRLGSGKSMIASICKLLQKEMGTCDGWIDNNDAIIYIYRNSSKEMTGCVILEVNPVIAYQASLTDRGIKDNVRDQTLQGIVVGNRDKREIKKSQCAVRLMWTSKSCRRQKIASKLLDCARAQLIPGQIIPRENVAFSQPSQDGGIFILRYTGSSEFLVYE